MHCTVQRSMLSRDEERDAGLGMHIDPHLASLFLECAIQKFSYKIIKGFIAVHCFDYIIIL